MSEKNNEKSSIQKYLPILVLIAALSVAIFLMANNQPDQIPQVVAPQENPIVERALGGSAAVVTITEFADFGCITCKAWHQTGIKDQILEKYGDQVRFVWRDFPIISANSPKAAEAGFCANDQGKFWEYHDLLYQNAPALRMDNLKQHAADLGLETQRFNQCLDSGQYTAIVDAELQAALGYGFRGVPSFMVNGEPLIGPPSFEQLSIIIDEIVNES